MVGPPCCRPAGTDLLACLEAAERNILPHRGLGEAVLPTQLTPWRGPDDVHYSRRGVR